MAEVTESRSYKWSITLNNYDDYQDEFDNLLNASFRYLFFTFEVGELGTPHIQGYVEFHTRYRGLTLSNVIGKHWHNEVCKSTKNKKDVKKDNVWARNFIYCSKDVSNHKDYYEFGEPICQGYRTDLDVIRKKISCGESMESIADNFFSRYCVYKRPFEAYSKMKQKTVDVDLIDSFQLTTKYLVSECKKNNISFFISSSDKFEKELYNRQDVIIFSQSCVGLYSSFEAYKLMGNCSDYYPATQLFFNANHFMSPELLTITSLYDFSFVGETINVL
nr:MAG: replication associated protein [Cressdnaviricota sp.]